MSKKNTAIVSLSIIAVLGIVGAGVGFLSNGFQNWNLEDWKNHFVIPTPSTSDPIDTSSNEPSDTAPEEPIEENGWEYHVLEIDTSVPQSTLQLKDGTYAIFGRNNDICVVSFPEFGLKANSTSADSSTLVPLEVIPNYEYVIVNDIDIYGFYGSINDLNYGRIMTLEQETGYFVWRLSELSYYAAFIIQPVYFSINQS